MYRVVRKNLAKFSDTCSVRADGLYIGSPRIVGGRKAGKFKHAKKNLHHTVFLFLTWNATTATTIVKMRLLVALLKV